ncbi:hypothetical protein B0T16DRAFT_395785 [Cercophora newfieldiana]|uniref:F-box domain-containing protein n=1 Tax=Cercophora newfieldiana TaxID=92897 RepID=A0AA39YM03_9PEZI|nr:hypothetical protein B0T16DRAFT_395785 [Cercophora newfieldiana]
MPTLSDLPVELLIAICSHLWLDRRKDGQADVSRLSRTCTYFRNALQPLVFTSFVRPRSTDLQLAKLLRALVHRPDLAQNLKYFHLKWNDMIFLPVPDCDFINSLLIRLNIHLTDHRTSLLPVLDLVLLHAPNLVHLAAPLCYESKWRLDLLSTAGAARTPAQLPTLRFPHLRALGMMNPHILAHSSNDLSTAMAICGVAPQLENLYFSHDPKLCFDDDAFDDNGELDPDWDFNRDFPLLPSLRRVEFERGCSLPIRALRALLAAAVNLEAFHIHWSPVNELEPDWDLPEAAEMWRVLKTSKGTLKELKLDIYFGEGHVMEVGELGWSSLADFERLELLHVGPCALEVLEHAWLAQKGVATLDRFLENMLPEGIREIVLQGFDIQYVAHFSGVAEAISRGRFPALRSVVVAPIIMDGVGTNEPRDEEIFKAQRVFQGTRVRFDVDPTRALQFQEPSGAHNIQYF